MPNLLTKAAAWLDSPAVNRVLAFIGRLGIAYLFCSAAIFHLTQGWDLTMKDMRAQNLPMPELLNIVAMTVSGGLALALLFNIRARWAALGLALYTIVVSSVMYTPGPGVSPQILVLFMKDMAVFGGLLALSCALSANTGVKGA